MLLIQSHDRFDEVLLMDCTSGTLSMGSRMARPDLAGRPIRGHFTRHGDALLVFYRCGNELHLRLGEQDLTLGDDATAEVVDGVDGEIRELSILDQGHILLRYPYPKPQFNPPLEQDPTPFVEPEHFDFGLFIHNVLGDADRRERMYRWREDSRRRGEP